MRVRIAISPNLAEIGQEIDLDDAEAAVLISTGGATPVDDAPPVEVPAGMQIADDTANTEAADPASGRSRPK